MTAPSTQHPGPAPQGPPDHPQALAAQVAGGGGAPTTGEVADATPPDVYHDPVPAPPGTADGAKPQVRQIAEGVEAEIPTERHDLVRE